MPKQLLENLETVAPNAAETRLAIESSRLLARYKLGRKSSVNIKLSVDGGSTESVSVPSSAVRLFLQLLNEMALGHTVTLIPTHAELTTQQAADILNVSRPFMVKLLDDGKIPVRTVGKYRRVRFEDLIAYKRKDDEARTKVLDQLVADAQSLGMGY